MRLSVKAAATLLILSLLPATGYSGEADSPASSLAGTVVTGKQLLVAIAESRETSQLKLYALERTTSGWELRKGPLPGITGRKGFAPPGEKREGDGRAPSGYFPLEFAFGYAPTFDGKMPYRQATENDLWVDDARSPDYNTWVKRGESSATSFEVMKLADNRYRHGIVIGYNRSPVIKGHGSGIFVHAWLEEGYTTTGCVAINETELVSILSWLDPAQKPQILMGTRQDLAVVKWLPPLPAGTDQAGMVERQIRAKVSRSDGRLVEYRAADVFFGMALEVPDAIANRMRLKKSWHEGCPVPLTDLSYLVLTYRGMDDAPKVGEMVVHKKLALPVIKAFAELFSARFPIEKMELIDAYDANDDRSMQANNSSGFNCREITGKPGSWSKHSYGGAIDINPLLNPYVSPKKEPLTTMGWDGAEDKGSFLGRNGYTGPSPAFIFCTQRPADCLVLPPAGVAHLDRSQTAPGYLLPNSAAVKAFTGRGFDWGGSWGRLLDYQHFEYDTKKLLQ